MPRHAKLGTTGRSVPLRTCVGCRDRAAKSDLLRLVVVEGVIVPDPRGRLPGRGASLHPTPRCFELAERRRAFPRAFRLAGPLDVSLVRKYLADLAASPFEEHGAEQAHEEHDESREAGRDCDERPMSTRR